MPLEKSESVEVNGQRYDILSAKDTQSEVQRMLLSGQWRMMADICPITHFPLFLNKHTNELWSVKLQLPVHTKPSIEPPPPSSSNLEVTSKNLSSRIGAKLLQGWELVEETDEENNCPLMKTPEGTLWSPYTETVYIPRRHVVVPQPSAAAAAAVTFDDEDEDVISSRIGQKLLQGWEMMAESCPVTRSCPLMRNPLTGKMWSPALNDYLKEENKDRKVQVVVAAPVVEEKKTTAVVVATTGESRNALTCLEDVLLNKIRFFGSELQASCDASKCLELMAVIKELLGVLKETRSMHVCRE